MVASKLSNYWSKKDKNGVKVSNWAKESDKPRIALCKFCFDCEVDFKAGSYKLTRHSESAKHMNNSPKASTVQNQPTILKFSKVVSIGLKIGLQMVFISPKKWSSFGLQWRLLMVFKLVTISECKYLEGGTGH